MKLAEAMNTYNPALSEIKKRGYAIRIELDESQNEIEHWMAYKQGDINILDGNVDLLMQMPIIFKNFKHYNRKNNLKIKCVMNDGNYLMRNKEILYKL